MLRTTLLASLLFASSAPAQLIGLYTVNPTQPTAGSNFTSLLDATTALAAQGVGGPVWFDLYDDAGPFTETTPFSGPHAPNTAVLVLGSWTGASANNRITFRPAAGERVVFDASGHSVGVFWGGADYVTVQDLEIKNAIHDGISLYSDANTGIAQDPIIDGCRIHDCGGTGVTIYGNTPQPANTLVQNCTFWRLQLTNAGGFNTTGRFGYVTTRRSNGTRIVHNTFYADTGAGSSFCVIGAYPSSTTEVPYAEVSNNVVVKLVANGAIFRIQSPAGTTYPAPVVCDSNCFLDLSGGTFALHGTGAATVASTLLDWQTATQRDLNSLNVDPLFRDVAAADFHLLPASPCRSASTVAANVGLDRDGQPRTTPIDIGADEIGDGAWSALGTGCPGTGGATPTLATSWPFLGSLAYSLHVANLPPGTIAFLFGSLGVTTTPVLYGGICPVHLDLSTLTALAAAFSGPGGTTSFVLSVPPNPAFIGFNIGYQGLALDAGAALGVSMSNALDVTFAF
jgi:Right handed beta helix region